MSDIIIDRLDKTSATLERATNTLFAVLNAGAQVANRTQLDEIALRLFGLEDRLVLAKLAIKRLSMLGEANKIDLKQVSSLREGLAGILADLASLGIGVPILDGGLPSIGSAAGPGTTAGPAPANGATAPTGSGVMPTSTPVAAVRKGVDILAIAKRHLGQEYRNINVDYADANWRGAMDCAEYASYCVWRSYGILYGARLMSGTEPIPGRLNVEAYTGYWKEDVFSKGKVITSEDAFNIPGAFVLRFPPGPGKMGHIAICLGDGKSTYEAADATRGIIQGSLRMSDGAPRRWDTGVLIPGVDYGKGAVVVDVARIYRSHNPPLPPDEVVEQIQAKLAQLGFLAQSSIDGEFGEETAAAVAAFQRARGLLVDGEVGPDTGAALGLGHIWDGPSSVTVPASGSTTPVADGTATVSAGPTIPSGVTVRRSSKFADIQQEYIDMYAAATIRPTWQVRASTAADKIIANRARYESVSALVGKVPWFFTGVIHNMEASLNFATHLHNGDPLGDRTVHVPANRPIAPPANGASYTWEESAVDALRQKDFHVVTDWSLARMLFRLELFNGFGSRKNFGIPTAYLWSGTNVYERGKYVADHKWDPNAVSEQVGCVTLLKTLEAKGAIKL